MNKLLEWLQDEWQLRRFKIEYLGRHPVYESRLYKCTIWSQYVDGGIRPTIHRMGIGSSIDEAVENCILKGVPVDGNPSHSYKDYSG